MKKEHTHYQNTQNKTVIDSCTRLKIKAEIVFGSPSLGCKGSGVCKVLPSTVSMDAWKCSHATAWLSITNCKGVRMLFPKASMTDRQAKVYFRWHLFQVFEPVPMPGFIQKRLGMSAPLIIRPGIYQVCESDKFWAINFKTNQSD